MKVLTACIIVLALAGVLISAMALKEHYSNEASPCKINDKWDCGAVNHSPYAVFHGFPVAGIGIMGYAMIIALAGRARLVTAIAAVIGLGFALWLTQIEARVLLVWCIYCVSSQIIIFLIAVLAVIEAIMARRRANA
jgi:vitamin-K-epoxide reductase (warfarin-sensitive)